MKPSITLASATLADGSPLEHKEQTLDDAASTRSPEGGIKSSLGLQDFSTETFAIIPHQR